MLVVDLSEDDKFQKLAASSHLRESISPEVRYISSRSVSRSGQTQQPLQPQEWYNERHGLLSGFDLC